MHKKSPGKGDLLVYVKKYLIWISQIRLEKSLLWAEMYLPTNSYIHKFIY